MSSPDAIVNSGDGTLEEVQHKSIHDFVQMGPVTAIYLQEMEWTAICKGVKGILRSFQCRDDEMLVVVRRKGGHEAVGYINVGLPVEETKTIRIAASQHCGDMYPRVYLDGLKQRKTYLWTLSNVIPFARPHFLKCSDSKYKNRTFKIESSMLHTSPEVGPQSQTLAESARFFIDKLNVDGKKAVEVFSFLGRDATIRVGSTCSGSDVCVTVLKQTIAFLNRTQAGFRKIMLIMAFPFKAMTGAKAFYLCERFTHSMEYDILSFDGITFPVIFSIYLYLHIPVLF